MSKIRPARDIPTKSKLYPTCHHRWVMEAMYQQILENDRVSKKCDYLECTLSPQCYLFIFWVPRIYLPKWLTDEIQTRAVISIDLQRKQLDSGHLWVANCVLITLFFCVQGAVYWSYIAFSIHIDLLPHQTLSTAFQLYHVFHWLHFCCWRWWFIEFRATRKT